MIKLNYITLLIAIFFSRQAISSSSEHKNINPFSLLPTQGYSHVVIAPPGRLVSISGKVAIDETRNIVCLDEFEAQCIQVFENLQRALNSKGLTFANVVRTDMYVTNLKHLDSLREVRARYLLKDVLPTNTLVKVDSSYRPELLIEVAAEAVMPNANVL